MVVGIDRLLELVQTDSLVEGLAERELKNPEGTGFDLRIGELYEVVGKGFMGVTERETPEMNCIKKYNKSKSQIVKLKKGKYYLFRTIEKINVPPNMFVLLRPRSTFIRSGVYIYTGNLNPSWSGQPSFGMMNFRDEEFELEMGARVCHVFFLEVSGKTHAYRGQWQGGRVTTKKREVQV